MEKKVWSTSLGRAGRVGFTSHLSNSKTKDAMSDTTATTTNPSASVMTSEPSEHRNMDSFDRNWLRSDLKPTVTAENRPTTDVEDNKNKVASHLSQTGTPSTSNWRSFFGWIVYLVVWVGFLGFPQAPIPSTCFVHKHAARYPPSMTVWWY